MFNHDNVIAGVAAAAVVAAVVVALVVVAVGVGVDVETAYPVVEYKTTIKTKSPKSD